MSTTQKPSEMAAKIAEEMSLLCADRDYQHDRAIGLEKEVGELQRRLNEWWYVFGITDPKKWKDELTREAELNGKGSEREARLMARVIELQAEVARLKANIGCAREQGSTQYCAEVLGRDKRIAELEEALRAKVAELEQHKARLEEEILNEIEDAARLCCHTARQNREHNGIAAGSLITDSGAISSNAANLRRLAEAKRFRIVSDFGRMVIGYWPENDPNRSNELT